MQNELVVYVEYVYVCVEESNHSFDTGHKIAAKGLAQVNRSLTSLLPRQPSSGFVLPNHLSHSYYPDISLGNARYVQEKAERMSTFPA